MFTVKIYVEPYVAQYIQGKYTDEETGVIRFPANSDIYVLLFDLLARRPAASPVDHGNLTLAIPDRKCGKKPCTYNWLSDRAVTILANKMKLMFWAELHHFMDENKHREGIQFKDSAYRFMARYDIDAITEDALLKNYQRWRDKQRRRIRRSYRRK